MESETDPSRFRRRELARLYVPTPDLSQ